MENLNNKKRIRDGDDDGTHEESCDVKRLREDLFLDDDGDDDDTVVDPSDLVNEIRRTSSTEDLASVMKSFEEEINCEILTVSDTILDLKSESGESQPELGYLLEASDDELGLPPSTASTTNGDVKTSVLEVEELVPPEYAGFGEFCRFDDEFSDFGLPEGNFGGESCYDGGGGYVAFDGLFDYPDVYFDSVFDNSWRTETLPAL